MKSLENKVTKVVNVSSHKQLDAPSLACDHTNKLTMSVLNLQSFCNGNLPQSRPTPIYAQQQQGTTMNKFIKKVFSSNSASRQDSNLSRSASTSKPSPGSSHPQASGAPSTRRPNSSLYPNNPFADAPPAYSPNPAPMAAGLNQSYYQSTASYTPEPSTSTASSEVTDDDKFAFLSEFDTKFLVDDSGSMAGSNWRETRAAIEAIAETCVQYDDDGIDMYFINKNEKFENVTSAGAVREIFESTGPRGRTPLGQRLQKILSPYLLRCERGEEPKPINVIVITDGAADDDVGAVVEGAAKRLDKIHAVPWQVGIQFFQVGRDADATAFLEELDDDLTTKPENVGMRDIVDTQPYRAQGGSVINRDGILKTVLGAVNKRYDRKKGNQFHH